MTTISTRTATISSSLRRSEGAGKSPASRRTCSATTAVARSMGPPGIDRDLQRDLSRGSRGCIQLVEHVDRGIKQSEKLSNVAVVRRSFFRDGALHARDD